MSSVGARRRRRGGNTGPHLHAPQAARASASRRRRGHRSELRPKLAQVPGIRSFLQNPPPIRIGGRSPRACTSSRCRAPTPTSSTRRAARSRRSCAALPGLQDVTSDLQITNPQVDVDDRPRPRRGARRHARSRSRRRSYNAYGSRQVSTIYTPTNQYWVILELLPRVPARPGGARRCSTSARRTGTLVPLDARRDARRTSVGPLTVNHSGQLPVGDALVQPARRASSLGDAVDAGRAASRARRCPPTITHELPGHGAGVPVVARRAWAAPAHRRDPRHLHRARHPLRELHPPAHDPLRPAVRRASARCSRCCSSASS